MASVYVSYRSTDRAFVEDVLSRLEPVHRILVDYNMPAGVEWRSYQLEQLRRADVVLVFVSRDTQQSDFQNAEIGAARFCSAYTDRKLVLPALLDPVELPRTVKDLDCLDLTSRDPVLAAREIADAIARRPRHVRLFISHAHTDEDLASRLVDVITTSFEVPDGELRCTSVPGYQLELGAAAPDALRRELGSAMCVIGIITPNSIGNDWVLFELGAAWGNTAATIPLLAGGLGDRDLPGALRGAVGGALAATTTLDRVLVQLARMLSWPSREPLLARSRQYELSKYAAEKSFARDDVEAERRASFAARRARIGQSQGRLLDYITAKGSTRPYVPYDEITREFARMETSLYYRLEHLRFLGFLQRVALGESHGKQIHGWTLSAAYRKELGP